jgi:ABC-type dipeptide/oligopeptide/nickel transport system permease subunit
MSAMLEPAGTEEPTAAATGRLAPALTATGTAGPPGGGTSLPPKRLRAIRNIAWQNRLAVAGLVLMILLALFCFVGPLIYQTNQVSTNLLAQNLPPSAAHPLGTTPQGRDELGQLMLGGQSTLEVGFAVAFLATAFGMAWGAVAGYVGGFIDALMMRVVDAVLAIPFLFFVVLLASILTPNLSIIILAITAASWLSTARLVRGEVLSLRTRDYVAASRSFGGRHPHVILRHLAPNVLGVVAVNATLKMADAILTFAGVAFLGLSVPPPATSWGDMLTTGINNLFDGYWWQLWPPAITIVLVVLAANVVGDGLHDIVERRLERR